MANNKTVGLLPQVFQTDTNKKFLNATLDQLVSSPDFVKINGYVGRRFAPTTKSTDYYLEEKSDLRQNYQLEPSVVVKNKSGDTEFFGNYIDLLQQIEYYGGNIANHDRLFNNTSYTYNGMFDFDKFVNFNQYYWLPEGPITVPVLSTGVPITDTITVTRDTTTGAYKFSTHTGALNPELILAYGGSYQFRVNQPGVPFWIQIEPGTSGLRLAQPNTSSRDILGVTNNGTDVGTITFNVPQATAQDNFSQLVLKYNVDIASDLPYSSLQGRLLSDLVAQGGIDGITTNLVNKTVIFVNPGTYEDDAFWTDPNVFDATPVPVQDRFGVWTIRGIDDGAGNITLNLVAPATITSTEKVFVRSGSLHANSEYRIDSYGYWAKIPLISASALYLYYQDNEQAKLAGRIKLVEVDGTVIDIEDEILGKAFYKSPNGVVFTNGLKISFDTNVLPSSYADKEYFVEGVGTAISLVPADQLLNIANYISDTSKPDYVTINRSSLDRNPWSRTNRWFHIDVINAAADYWNVLPTLAQSQRASRPIIEFEPNLQLFNNGTVAKDYVSWLDTGAVTNAFLTIENRAASGTDIANIVVGTDTVTLSNGDRVIFSADTDPEIANRVYIVNIVDFNEDPFLPDYRIHLTAAEDAAIEPGNSVWAKTVTTAKGKTTNAEHWFNGSSWQTAQQKTGYNQSPLFDIFTDTNSSLSERRGSSFVGSKIFSYKTGTGRADPVLGFPLSYRNFNNVGDIQFSNDFDNDSYQYLIERTPVTEPVNNYFIRQNTGVDTYAFRNVWTQNTEQTKQYQFFTYTFTGETNYFVIDVLPAVAEGSPNIVVYKNTGKTVDTINDTDYSIVRVNGKDAVRVNINLLSVNDIITIKIYSNSVSQIGSYEVPKNLDLNSLNSTFSLLTLGQIRNHLVTLSHNSTLVAGPVPGDSNLRDIPIKNSTGSILQHASPAIYSNLFLLDKNLNFVKSIEYAQKEYTKFKNKFLELALTSGLVDTNNIPNSVDRLLAEINKVKNSNFAWYYSDMVPYGSNIQPLAPYQILDPEIQQYEIPTVFNDSELSDRAVLVYYAVTKKDAYGELILDSKNRPIITSLRSLVKGQDYYFNQDRPAVTLTENVAQIYNDLIVIKDYVSTNGSYIPETPTKLGLYPKFVPGKYYDTTYVTPVTVIQGHDGSITPSFNDYRDDLLLELELRIYNNIKVSYNDTLIDITKFIPGKFRSTEYSLKEFNEILSTAFLKWVGSNKVDYTTNKSYNSNDPFTWNYKNFTSTVDGTRLEGSWRAIFKHYFDTDRPHTHPWEMLGLSEQPSWWEARYGVAPYTGGNLVLWTDLSLGYIYGENRYDEKYARPALLNIIPVDDTGNLRSPEKFLVADFNGAKTNTSFAVGDIGPTENAWRRSSDYAFALQQAMALMKPGFYFGTLMNVDNYNVNVNLNQIVLSNSLQRISPIQIKINGLVAGQRQRTVGYINWIGDYLTNLGIAPGAKIIDYLKNLSVQLSYKMAGFSGKNYLKILAEQSSPTSTNQSIIIPDNNYELYLNKSTPIKKINYSAVIVQRSGAGWTVSGYDTENPYFTIIPSLANSNVARIEVGSAVGIIYQDFQNYKLKIPYGYEFNSRQQVVDFLISYGRYLTGQGMRFNVFNGDLETVQDWTLSSREFLSWSQQGWRAGSILVLSPVIDQLNIIANTGTVDYIENNIYGSKILDQDSNVIKSTGFTVLRYGNEFKLKANAGQTIGFAQLNVVQYEHALIFENTTLFNDIIYTPELGNRQYRLKIVGNRTGSWTGKLDIPGFIYNNEVVDEWKSNTDYRKGSLVKHKNNYYIALNNLLGSVEFNPAQWQQIAQNQIKTGLLNNFNYNAQEFENIYDINNQPQDEQLSKFSNGLIGFRERSYLTDLGLDIDTQSKFYQGYIKQKGTRNAVDALNTVALNNIQSSIETFEEWAVRVGEYGSIDSNSYLELILDEQKFNSDPETFVLLNSGETAPDQIIGVKSEDLYYRPNDYQPALLSYTTQPKDIAIPITAGYVNLADIDATLYDIREYANLNSLLDNIGNGYKIWVAKDFVGDWNVYRVSETANYVTNLAYALNGLATVTTYNAHNFAVGDVIAIKGLDTDFDGFYRVFELNDNNSFYVVASRNPAVLQKLVSVDGPGILFKLSSLRTNDISAVVDIEPLNLWRTGDTIWADNAQGPGQWQVYKKFDTWTAGNILALSDSNHSTNSEYGTSIAATKNSSMLLVGAPAAKLGNINASSSSVTPYGYLNVFYKNNNTGAYNQSLTLQPNLSVAVTSTGADGIRFGTSIDLGDRLIAVGAPGAVSNRGAVLIYKYNAAGTDLGTDSVQQIIIPTTTSSGSKFGTSVAMSDDNRWLYISAPYQGTGNVYVYQQRPKQDAVATIGNLVPGREYTILTTGTTNFTLLGAKDNTVGTIFTASQTGNVSVGDFVVNEKYTISKVGTTDFTLLGATSNSVGTVFMANNTGSTAATNFVPTKSYTIVDQGNTDFTIIGSAPSAVFTANVTENVLEVWSVASGSLSENCTITGVGISPGTKILAQINGTPGAEGRYLISDSFILANATVQSQPVLGTTFTANAVGAGSGVAVQGTGMAVQGTGTVKGDLVEVFNVTKNIAPPAVDPLKLKNIPTDLDSLLITNGTKIFARYVDWTYNSMTNTITLLADARLNSTITITSSPYYKLIHTLTPPAVTGVSNVNWGETVKTTGDGRRLIVADPIATVKGLNKAGAVSVFDRIVETFIGDGVRDTFTPIRSLPAYTSVFVDGLLMNSGTDYVVNDNSVQFVQSPPRGKLVEIEINDFKLITTLGTDVASKLGYFGKSVDISTVDHAIYVGAPGYTSPEYYGGRVYRYANQGRAYGSITSTKANPTLTIGNSIFVNGFEVPFLTANVDTITYGISNARIPGVSASIENGVLTIASSSVMEHNRLDIVAGQGTNPLDDLGLEIYPLTQYIESPRSFAGQRFGSCVHVASSGTTLFVSSQGATMQVGDHWDGDATIIDRDSTTFDSRTKNTGAVYAYDYIATAFDSIATPSQFSYVQEFYGDGATVDANFGCSIKEDNGVLLIGANKDSASAPTAGDVYVFNNPNRALAWQVIRSNTNKVDIANLNRLFIYNKRNQEIAVNLDLFDPAKGKILGVAEQELDYITSYDPARYNQDNPVLDTFQPLSADDAARTPFPFNYVGTTAAWGRAQVGQLWWNLDACRYIDYEQDSLTYKSKNWGALFPGSAIEVCEWVESSVPPGSYTGPGTAKYPDNSAYSLDYNVDAATGMIISRYYYWVVNKTSADSFAAGKTRTAADVANIIQNPQNAGVSYAAALDTNAFNLYNINRYVSGSDAILHLDYSRVKNENIIHSEYELIKENTARSLIPKKIVDKMLDSFVGETIDYRKVPNPTLPAAQKIGISSRPMQSMFQDRYKALQVFVDYVNQVMIKYPVILEFDIQKFYKQDPLPAESTYNLKTDNYEDLGYIDRSLLPVGYRILVTSNAEYDGLWTVHQLNSDREFDLTNVQKYRTDTYVDQVNWFDSSFDPSQEIQWVVDTLEAIETIQASLTAGDIILVNNDGSGRFAYYRVSSDLTIGLVGLQNGTIQIKESIYDPTGAGAAFGSGNFDNERFDQYPVDEIRNIFDAIKDDVFVKSLDSEFNRLFFVVINYLLSEQKTTDWIFKTSFISVLHKIRKLDQYPSFVRDNQTYYQDYINEVKPYRTQIREYLLDYQGSDTFNGNITDFSLPARYDPVSRTYHSPTLSNIEDPEYMASLPAELRAEYLIWYRNYKSSVTSIELYNAGTGYTKEPSVIVLGGGGSGATANASIWQGNGAIRSVTITNPGTGYTTMPTVYINGDGSRDTGANIQLGVDQGYIAYANLISGGSGFTVAPTIFVEGIGTGAVITCTINSQGSIDSTTIVDSGYDYDSSTIAKIIDPGTNAFGVAKLHNVYYKPDPAQSYNTVRGITSKIRFDRVSYTSNIADWSANTTYHFGDTVRYQGQAFRANATVYPSAILSLGSNVSFNVGDTIVTSGASGVTGNANVSVAVTQGNILFVSNTQGVLSGGLPYVLGQQIIYGPSPSYHVTEIPVTSVTSVFDRTKYIEVAAGDFDNAADRTIAYYTPGADMPGRDLGQLFAGTDYPGVRVDGTKFDQKVSFASNVIQFFATNSTIYSTDISRVNFNQSGFGIGQTVTVSGTVFNNQDWTINTVQDDALVVYSPLIGVNILNEPVGVDTTFTYYNENDPFDLDTVIQSSYLDTTLGTRPEDINISGGAYVDRYSSHAPEELMPGRLYDNLNIEVWTQMYSATANVGFRIYHGMNNDPTTQLMLELSEPITVTNTYPTNTYITQVYLDSANPQANARVVFGPGVDSITSNQIPVEDVYQHGIDFYGFVAADDRTVYVDGVDTGVAVTHVSRNSWPTYYTISPANITVLSANLNITDTEIQVENAYALPQGGAEAAIPGAVIINGEKIYYYRNYAKEVVPWTANTVYASDAIVSYLGQEYVANVAMSANLYGAAFDYNKVNSFNVHRLTQLRRAVDGTGAPVTHVAGSRVVDASEQQRLGGNVHLTTWLKVASLFADDQLLTDNNQDTIATQNNQRILTKIDITAPVPLLENSTTLTAITIRRAAGLTQ